MVRWAGNGHFYELVPTWRTWLKAKDDAASRTFLGAQGHLATITSAEEQAFIVNTFSHPLREASLGGYQDGGQWRWVTTEPWSYTNWAPGEPNGEDYLAYHGGSFLGAWNDRPNSDTRHYFVEYPVQFQEVIVTSYNVTLGTHLGGTLFELLLSDNTYMSLGAGISFQRSVPNAQLEVVATVPSGNLRLAAVTLESAVSTSGVMERISLFDFVANQWVTLGERFPALADSETLRSTLDTPGRFLHPATREIRARIGWFDRGAPTRNWLIRIDKVAFGVAFH
jgi:hypothetical protein